MRSLASAATLSCAALGLAPRALVSMVRQRYGAHQAAGGAVVFVLGHAPQAVRTGSEQPGAVATLQRRLSCALGGGRRLERLTLATWPLAPPARSCPRAWRR